MRWNDETAVCALVLAASVAGLVLAWRGKTVWPLLWIMRATLLALMALCAYEIGIKIGLRLGGIQESAMILAIETGLFTLTFLRLPRWLVWTAYGLFLMLAAAAFWFAAFFTIRMM